MMVDLSDKRVLIVIASRNFRDEEYQKPRSILTKKGAHVTVASSVTATATGMFGLKVKPDVLLQEVIPDDFDAVIFIGGSGASEFWGDPTAHSIVQQAVEKNKILGAICVAPVTLANAGALAGKRVTVWPSEAGKVGSCGAYYTGNSVEQDGNIITANGPEAAEQFGEMIARTLASS